MPLTPAHTAAAWPVSRLFPSLPVDALVLGTMVPDFEYFLELAPRGRFGHSPLGLLVFCLPVGLVSWAIFRRVVRPASLTLLPSDLRPGLVARRSNLLSVIAAILLGAGSHSMWDSFTHARGWAVHQIPALSTAVHLAGLGDVRIFKMLQHGSTILGLVAVAVWVWRWIERQAPNARVYRGQSGRRAVRLLAILLATGAGGAFLNGLRGVSHGMAVGLGYAAVGGMAALAIALLVFGLVVRQPKVPEAPT
jgi:Domain of unknown function (DUF4184)